MKSPSPPSRSLAQRLQAWGFSWGGLRDNRHGEWWVIAQMLLIGLHLLPAFPSPRALGFAWPLPLRLVGLLIFLVGLALAAQGALNLGENLSPAARTDARRQPRHRRAPTTAAATPFTRRC